MKKIQFLLTFFAAALMFGLIGCQKDVALDTQSAITETNSATSARRVSLFDSQPVIEHADIIAKIEAFKTRLAKIENGILSPKDVPMAVEEAIWNIEALSNSRYCQAQLPFQDLISQKATLEIPLNDKGDIDNQALLAAVQTVKEMLRAQYYAVRGEQKHFIGIDIRPLVTKTVSKTHVSLEVESSIGIKLNTATLRTTITTPFNANDDWGGPNGSGRCDGSYIPQWSGSKLTTALNNRSGPIINNVYFTSIETVYITSYPGVSPNLINPNDPIPGDNIRDYLIYVNQQNASNYNERLCIDDTDMNWYFNNWWDTVIPTFKPVGKSFMEVTNFVQDGVLSTVIQHGAYIKYGVGNYSEDPPIVP